MAISEQLLRQGFHGKEEDPGYTENEGSETSRCVSDYSESDPIFDITEETHSRLSQLSIEKKPKSRLPKVMDLSSDSDLDGGEVIVPQLDKKDKKTFEKVQEIIQADQLDKLKVDQCKVYLRKHSLRLTGKKEILIQRIKEHRDVVNGGGERKYPASSFVLNCKGDACTGDVVMFEQNVYDMYNIASRSATGPPCCTRMVAGRIVKESYGSAKQQHTFTIEVLWSKGEKPLPPLHPLLIKGRNLYRLNTMRQKWDDEGKRVKTLLEKHSRGFLARANREARVQEKKTRKILKTTRASRNAEAGSNPVKSGFPEKPAIRPQIPQNQLQKTQNEPYHQIQREHPVPNVCKENIGIMHDSIQGVHPQGNPKLQPMTNMNHYPLMIPSRGQGYPKLQPITNTTHYPPLMNPFHGNYQKQNQNDNSNPGVGYQSSKRFCGQEPMATENHHPLISSSRGQQGYPQVCRYYPKGRCHYGDNCKFLHELSVVHAQRKEPRFGQHP